ncbi:MAG TPA: hypothetical protein VF469_37935 [Kofleriaceae bacterium]
MAARRCPKCNLINPETTTTCDCGWSFTDGAMGAPPSHVVIEHEEAHRRERRSRGSGRLAIGALLLVVGIVITAATYGSASTQGGTYIIAYGPIIFGVINIFRGLAMMNG